MPENQLVVRDTEGGKCCFVAGQVLFSGSGGSCASDLPLHAQNLAIAAVYVLRCESVTERLAAPRQKLSLIFLFFRWRA